MPVSIRNFLEVEKKAQGSSHGGSGLVDLYEIWSKPDFKSDVDFIDRMVVPPKSTVGHHKHGNNEEMYIVLSGNGVMTIGGETVTVEQGDMILNPPHGEHGLRNESDADIDILVLQVPVQGGTLSSV